MFERTVSITPLHKVLTLLSLATLFSGCTSTGFVEPQEPSYSQAVQTLIEKAAIALQRNEFVVAENALERALRIEPENPNIWLKLSELNCRQNNFYDCKNLALRGKSYTSDGYLTRQFDQLIKQSNR